jgi:hypothetical protein
MNNSEQMINKVNTQVYADAINFQYKQFIVCKI